MGVMVKFAKRAALAVLVICSISSCKLLRYVPEDEFLLKKTNVVCDVKFDDVVPKDYIHQTPNNYFMGIGRMKLAFYSASDTAKHGKWDTWLRKIGEPPEIYDSLKRVDSEYELKQLMFNKGYMEAEVTSDLKVKKRQATVTYNIVGNEPHRIRNYIITIPDSAANEILKSKELLENRPKRGEIFDIDRLNQERERIANAFRDNGYYYFRKELLFFTVDSALGTHEVDIELALQEQYAQNDSALSLIFTKPVIKDMTVLMTSENMASIANGQNRDTIEREGVKIVYDGEKPVYKPRKILDKTLVAPGDEYNEKAVDLSNERLNSMPSAKYVNFEFREQGNDSLDCFIILSPNKPHTISAEAQVTYSEGDIGVLGGFKYTNNNIFRGSETLDIGVNGGWEGIGSLNNFQNAWRAGGTVALRFPELLIPTSKEFRKKKVGETEISLAANYQFRPEYGRMLFNAAYKYIWTVKKVQFYFSLVDLSYIYMTHTTPEFEHIYLDPSSSIRFSYMDNFITKIGLNITYSNRRVSSANNPTYFTIRGGVKTAGNVFYGISKLFKLKQNDDGQYEFFNIAYAQYAKFDFDYAHNVKMSDKARMVFHAGLGIGIPYGNSTILPYEERYYSGGANSMRGWSPRTLGPGNFKNTSGNVDLMRQSGDIKLDLNIEARFKLFWKLEAAVFVDAGNIWTIKDYAEQPTGVFRFDTFYKQIACNYGVGLRLNFDFVVVRLDMGIKLYDPGRAEYERWRTDLTWKDDFALHFAVGYPF